jgi:hypothetical protein
MFLIFGRQHCVPTKLLSFCAPIIIGGLLLWGWDIVRIGQGAASFFALGQSRYTATMIRPLSDYPARFAEWWATVQYLFGNGFLTIIFFIVGIVGIPRKGNRISLILLAWIAAFSIAHIVLTLNLFDRNQIVLLPVAVVLVSSGLVDTIHRVPTTSQKHSVGTAWMLSVLNNFIPISLFLCFTVFSLSASFRHLPIGGDDGQHDGIEELADYLNSKPVATVIYDPWLDWELDYYMGAWTNKRRVFYPSPDLLKRDALALKEIETRYFVVPIQVDESLWIDNLRKAGFIATQDYELRNFRVWALVPP